MQKIDDLLTEGHRAFTPLQKLIDQAALQRAWTAELASLLPKRLAGGTRITELRGSSLTIVCRDASIATRVRFLVPKLRVGLSSLGHFANVTTIDVRVAD